MRLAFSPDQMSRIAAQDPKLAAEIQQTIKQEEIAEKRAACHGRGGLINFIRLMWHVVEPSRPLVEGWVLESLCEHLEAVSFGDINRLLINVPPGPGWVENRVATKRGLIRLGDVRLGDEVLTHRGRYREVVGVFEQGVLPLLKVTTCSGRVTWPTADHPYLTPHGWKRADELVVGDVLAVRVPQEDPMSDEIFAIENAGTGECRCVEVEEDHTWTWDGVVVSNSTKSLASCVFWEAWEWGPAGIPSMRYICASYNSDLTRRDNIRFRRLIQSQEYQELWGDRFGPADAQGSVVIIGNDKTGWKMATSVGGSGTGHRADRFVIDDGNNPLESESPAVMETTRLWFTEVVPDRLNDLDRSAIINIQQRTNEGDISGIILKMGLPYVHLCIPMEYDSVRHCVTSIGWEDPRGLDDDGYPLSDIERDKQDGTLAWPERFSPQAMVDMKIVKGDYAWNGQYQQIPTPRGGGIFKREWIEPWPGWNQDGSYRKENLDRLGRIVPPALEYVCGWVDTAFTEKQENDFSAMVVCGVFRAEGKGYIEKRGDGTFVRVAEDHGFPKVIVLHAWNKRLSIHGPPERMPEGVDPDEWRKSPRYLTQRQEQWGLVEWVKHTVERFRIDYLGIETQAAGHTLEQELHRLHADLPCIVELVPARGDKVARGYAVQGSFSSRQIYFPQLENGSYPSWLEPLADDLFVFPKGAHDDSVDALTGAVKHLRDNFLFERRESWEAEEERDSTYQRNRAPVLPYDV